MDRLTSMRVFSEIVARGSFVGAAQALDMSNAVVTRHLAHLEETVGVRLLNRSTRRLSLTDAGQTYYDCVRQILLNLAEADALAASASTNFTGTLRINCHMGFGQLQLARLLPLFSKEYPNISIEIKLTSQALDLIDEAYDVGIFLDLQNYSSNMMARQLGISETILCASPDYIKARGMPKYPEDLASHACINFDYEQLKHSWRLKNQEETIDVPINSKIVSNNGELLRYCGLAGVGILIRTTFSLGNDLASGRLVRVLPDYNLGTISVTLVYPSRRLMPAKVRCFLDFMIKHYPDPERDHWLSSDPDLYG